MSDSPLYEAMREFIRATVALEVTKALPEVRSALTRETPKIIEGPAGKDGKDGANGVDGKDGRDGKDGADGKNGERGADGIATRAELDSMLEERFAELQVRSLADSYQGVYQPEKDYTRGNLATWGGSLFLALADTCSRPEQSPDWKLIVKRGADARK